ncbi:MAG: hypothetical protein UW71_C0030G0006 [Parcubacteria group bacterium GW2011_GWB1_44_7]|uniref:Transposase IS200-like domain-containing protein n=1 Tax=Candidatus Giovannonibacteria bacterium GW2011_GWA2_45_21 TaxID=1618649 RepID=A0A0G1PH38_9BACT|nr:MAG: hypothetical protein UW71_C0030G0006 [Parcubacteria group bacterium GW2011_GWB1_44_7]KKU04723.1 MAG: hypothetical protein UX06_C0010G0002 [Candidatus Giovannonibacteria bacterium GW2011_GWA2_45_21]
MIRTFALDEYYHLYNRGVDKRIVFENDSDYKRFVLLLYLCNGTSPVRFNSLSNWKGVTSPELVKVVFDYDRGKPLLALGAYCLMPNHFHILAREISENGISVFMQKVGTAYTMYFNGCRERTGALFQGVFKSEHANNDEYLKYLFSYIHLNPVKIIEPNWKKEGIADEQKIKQHLTSYPYSSYMDYLGVKREFSKILDRKKFPEYFPSKSTFNKCLDDWLKFTPKDKSKKAKP